MRVVSLLNSEADINTTEVYSVTSRTDMAYVFVRVTSIHMVYKYMYACRHMWKYTLLHLYTCTCRAYVNCGQVVYRAQDVVQCTSIVGAAASAAVSSDGSYSH